MTRERRSYKVGYGRPPKEHQWRKGKSGNPRGRPKRDSAIQKPERSFNPYLDVFLSEMGRLVELPERGVAVELSVFRAIVRATAAKGITGDSRSQRLLIETMDKVAAAHLDDLARMLRDVEEYKKQWPTKAWQASQANRPLPLPRPEHIGFTMERGVEMTGPWDTELDRAWKQQKRLLTITDELLVEAEKDVEQFPDCPDRKVRLKALKTTFRQLLADVPPGWNWREQLQ